MSICYRGILPAEVSIEDNYLIILTSNRLSGCDAFRFVINLDGSGGEFQLYQNGVWISGPPNEPRGLTSRSKPDLQRLYSTLKSTPTPSAVAPSSVPIVAPTGVASPPAAPVPIPATQNAPARAAAIGNVQVQVQAPVGQGVVGQPTQLTTNPIDRQKKTSDNEVWVSFNPSITVQERQFCRIIENFRTANIIAQQTKNQIKVNETFRDLSQSLNALLPDGKFQGWIMRAVFVSQASDGSAEVLLELPCNVYVGSNACDANPQNFYGTAPEGSRIYTELAKMTIGDFALTSGQFVYTDDKAFDRNRSVASFRFLKTASHCRAKEMPSETEFFGLKLEVISTIK